MAAGGTLEPASLGLHAPAWLALAQAQTEDDLRRALEHTATAAGHTATWWSRNPDHRWSASGPASGTDPAELAQAAEQRGPVMAEEGWLLGVAEDRVAELRCKTRSLDFELVQTLSDHVRVAWARVQTLHRLRELTTVDEVTRLHNARHLQEVLRTELARCSRHRRPFTLLFIDLDRFKAINDSLGHLVGTQVLSDIGQLLQDQLRRSDSAFRYGGDEFAVCLTDTTKEVAMHVLERLTDAIHAYARGFRDARQKIGASMGLASFPDDGETVDALLASADQAMYRAKRRRSNFDSVEMTVDMSHGYAESESTSHPRVLLLDVMSTLVAEPFEVAVPAFFDMSLEELFAAKDPSAWVEFEYGRIDEEEYCRRFFVDRRPVNASAFKAAMQAHYEWMPGVEALLEELQGLGVTMHALSNYSPWYQLIEEKLGLSRFMSWDFVSCKTGYRKPSSEAYTHVLDQLKVRAQDCVFVDDRAKNVAAADAVGMLGILRRPDIESLRRDLRDAGILVKPATADLPNP